MRRFFTVTYPEVSKAALPLSAPPGVANSSTKTHVVQSTHTRKQAMPSLHSWEGPMGSG